MIGLGIETSSGLTEFLLKVLTNVDYNCFCGIDQEEVIPYGGRGNAENIYFEPYLPLDDFMNTLSSQDCMIIFLKLELYRKSILESDGTQINTYDDFLMSQCEMLILITDGYYFEVYSKDIAYLNKIANLAREFGYKGKEKESDNDGRTGMNLW